MSIRVKFFCLVSLVVILLSINVLVSASEEKEKKVPEPKLIPLDLGAKDYVRILGGPPETVTMHSGFVVLEPGPIRTSQRGR
jgi:hypothetical protein